MYPLGIIRMLKSRKVGWKRQVSHM